MAKKLNREENLLEPINDDDDDDDDDDDGLEYEYVQRGKTQYLVVRGYSFTRQYSGRQTSSWVCCQRKPLGCKVTVSTYVHSDKIDVRRTHNHPAVSDRRDDREHLKVEVKKYTKQNETGDESMFESVEDVQYVMRGKTQYLVVGGHNFTLQRNGKHHSSWECCQRKPLGCKVTVAAYRNSSRVDIRRTHNHPIVTHRERCGRLSGAMKSTIVKTETPVPPSASTPSKSVEYVWGKTTMQLMVGGHRFCRKNIYSTYTSYECCQRASHGCKVTVNTYKDDRKLSVKNAPHNHPIIAARRGASSVGGTPTSAPSTSRPVSVDLLRPVKFADTNF